MPFKIDPVILGPVAMKISAVSCNPAKSIVVDLPEILRQKVKLGQQVELQVFRQHRHFCRADLIKNYLKHSFNIGAEAPQLARREFERQISSQEENTPEQNQIGVHLVRIRCTGLYGGLQRIFRKKAEKKFMRGYCHHVRAQARRTRYIMLARP